MAITRKFYNEDGRQFDTLHKAMVWEENVLRMLTDKDLINYAEGKKQDYCPSLSYGRFDEHNNLIDDSVDSLLWKLDTKNYDYICRKHFKGQGHAEIESYKSNGLHTRNNFHTDGIEACSEGSKLDYVKDFQIMNEEDYSHSINANSCIKTNFEEWFGDKDATVFCVLIEPCLNEIERQVNCLNEEFDKIEQEKFIHTSEEEFEI